MAKPKILIQFDVDSHASVFDSVVALDSEVDQLLSHPNVDVDNVEGLVHGAMFTRGPEDLHQTAIFIGGSNVDAAERLHARIKKCFFGPMRVSTMLDANGANTTAAAAVLAATKHVNLAESTCTVLAATGPVGKRVVRLLARIGAPIRVVSRNVERATEVCQQVAEKYPAARLTPMAASDTASVSEAVSGASVLFAAGAAGVELVSEPAWQDQSELRVAIDLNAVPPAGIGGIEIADKAVERHGVICYGPIGVGGAKMKIHKASIRRLFTSNSLDLDAEAIYEIGEELQAAK